MSNVLHLNTEEFLETLKNNEIVFVDFYANWCGPCKMLAPSIDKLANEHPEVKVVKIDVDNEERLAYEYGVQSIPTLITFKDGQPARRQMGFLPYEMLEDMIMVAINEANKKVDATLEKKMGKFGNIPGLF